MYYYNLKEFMWKKNVSKKKYDDLILLFKIYDFYSKRSLMTIYITTDVSTQAQQQSDD